MTRTYDVALLDLDGVVYVGSRAVPNAQEALSEAREAGMRLAFVTNNAFRPPAVVADHLVEIGVPAEPSEVVTSAMAAARVVADLVPAGSAVLVVGGAGLIEALAERGLRAVGSAEDEPAAVVQGYNPDLSWRDLAEGAYALQRGLPWVASNTDLTIPTPRGRAPGNGTLVAVLRLATGRDPVVAGKPEPPMHREAMLRTGAQRPLVVGDRLDTDIEGAERAGADSLLVLTGVTSPVDLVLARPGHRPDYLAEDLRGLLQAHATPAVQGAGWRCGTWHAEVRGRSLTLESTALGGPADDRPDDASSKGGDRWDALRAACAAGWNVPEGTLQRDQVEEALGVLPAVNAQDD